MKHLLGLIGFPLSHSFSPGYFREKFRREGLTDWDYQSFPLERIDELPTLLQAHPHVQGLNVTIPYKESVIPFLDELDEAAMAIGAVNTILIQGGRLRGYNTDAPAFHKVLCETGTDAMPGALVLGSGGASRAVLHVLHRIGMPFLQVSRSADREKIVYQDLQEELVQRYPLIIQTTPLGMFPHLDDVPPIPYHALGPTNLLFDLIYNPPETRFLREGRERGSQTMNGLKMLYLQAEMSWNIWTGNI